MNAVGEAMLALLFCHWRFTFTEDYEDTINDMTTR